MAEGAGRRGRSGDDRQMPPPECRAHSVERLVAQRSGIRLADLYAARRSSLRVTLARQTAMYLERVALGLGYGEIGRRFMRHPSTALHACRRIEDRRDDPDFDRWIARIEDKLAAQDGWPVW